MADARWYNEMAAAMNARQKCLNAIDKWQQQLEAAEAEIEALRAGEQTSAPIHAVVPTANTIPAAQFAGE